MLSLWGLLCEDWKTRLKWFSCEGLDLVSNFPSSCFIVYDLIDESFIMLVPIFGLGLGLVFGSFFTLDIFSCLSFFVEDMLSFFTRYWLFLGGIF